MSSKEQKITPLESIIQETYLEAQNIIEIVRKNNFEESLYPGFSQTHTLIAQREFDSIPNIIGTLLTTINDRLAQVNDKEKLILEELASELFIAQINELNSSEEGRKCWKRCIPVLKDTCDFKGYNFEALARILKIDFIKPSSKSKIDVTNLPYYEWLVSKTMKDELIRDIKDKGWIKNVTEFKKIFAPISNSDYTFSAPSEHKEKLLVLFSELKANKMILPKRNKGHLYPLSVYGVDLDKKLFKKEPKRYLENLKRKNEQYNRVLKEVQKVIRMNC